MTDLMPASDSTTYGTQSNRRIYYADFHQQLRSSNCPCRPVRCGRKRFSIVLSSENKRRNATEWAEKMENGKLSKEYIGKSLNGVRKTKRYIKWGQMCGLSDTAVM